MMKKLLFSFLVIVVFTSEGQFLLEDTKGRSSLIYNNNEAGTALFNTSEKKIEFNYFNYWRKFSANQDELTDQILTIFGSGQSKNDLAKLIEGNKLTPEGKLGFAYAVKFGKTSVTPDVIKDIQQKAALAYPYSDCRSDSTCINDMKKKRKVFRDQHLASYYDSLKPAESHWFYFKGEYTGSKFNLFNPDTVYAEQIIKTKFNAFDFSLGWNWFDANIDETNKFKGITSILGVSLGVRRSNNLSDLEEISLSDSRSFFSSDSLVTRSVKTTKSAYEGDYQDPIEGYIQLDWMLIPHVLNKVGVLLYGRIDDFSRLSRGFGVYLLKDKSNFTPQGGVNIGWVEDMMGETQFQVTLVSSISTFIN